MRTMTRMAVVGCVIAAFCTAPAVAADRDGDFAANAFDAWAAAEGPAMEKSADGFGLNPQLYMIDGSEFISVDGAGYLDFQPWAAWTLKNSTDDSVITQIRLPAGTQINALVCVFQDDDPVVGVAWNLLRKEWAFPLDPAIWGTSLQNTTADFDDANWRAVGVAWNEVIVNYSSPEYYIYVLIVSLDSDNPDINFWGCYIHWERTVSPAPVAATFADVPTGHWAFPFVEALAASGITAGCGGGNFCPDDPLTRAQMAVFLSTALGLHWPY